MRIEYASRARRDLINIKRYLHPRNPQAATNSILRILQSIKMLKTFPLIGRRGRIEGTRELVISDLNYIAYYRVTDECVYIERILHTSRKFPESYKN